MPTVPNGDGFKELLAPSRSVPSDENLLCGCIHLFNFLIVNRRFQCVCLEVFFSPKSFKQCKSKRHKCICNYSVHHAILCKATNHPCICKNSPHHAKFCKGTSHPCICLDDRDSVHHALMCRGENHPCICNRYSNFVLHCKHKGRCGFI